jgi:hypothetical protein
VNFNDILEQIKDRLKSIFQQVQESAAFQQALEKYEDLPSPQQRLIRIGGGTLFVLFLLSPPITTWLSSEESVDEFVRKRDVTRSLLSVVRDAANAPNIPPAPDLFSLQNRFQQELQQRDKLLPEQIYSLQASSDPGVIIPKSLSLGALTVNLRDLNLRQILDIGYRLATVAPTVKMTDIELTASTDKPGYFHFNAKVVALKAPEPPKFEPEEPELKKGRSRKSNVEEEE